MSTPQHTLSRSQIEAFYHDHFVQTQVHNYLALVPPLLPAPRAVIDVGGGCGFFAEGLRRAAGVAVRVLDTDPASIDACRAKGVDAELGDALRPPRRGDEDVICFNLVLHHLVGRDEAATLALQREALAAWNGHAEVVFVDEYIYDAWFANASGRLIYAITHSRALSALASAVSRWVPSLRANTFGVGVRFRGHDEWRRVFAAAGYRVVASVRGAEERVSPARRLLLIRSCRRDSFVLAADTAQHRPTGESRP
jgi:hypothetical protein